MCRSIKKLANVEPVISPREVEAASLQFVRKVSGMRSPSRINAEAFAGAVDEVSVAVTRLLAAIQK